MLILNFKIPFKNEIQLTQIFNKSHIIILKYSFMKNCLSKQYNTRTQIFLLPN